MIHYNACYISIEYNLFLCLPINVLINWRNSLSNGTDIHGVKFALVPCVFLKISTIDVLSIVYWPRLRDSQNVLRPIVTEQNDLVQYLSDCNGISIHQIPTTSGECLDNG